MTHIEAKACQLRDEAKRRVKSAEGFLMGWFSKSRNKTDESVEYYKRAGNLFKITKNWIQAGTAFYDAASLSYNNENLTEAALNFIEAADCFKKTDTLKAIDVYKEAIKLYRANGKFNAVAQYYQAIAELLQEEFDNDDAVKYYERAVMYFKMESRYSAANKCLERIGEYAGLTSDYMKAIKIFEDIACFDLASSIHRYQAKDYFFRAAICLLCTGTNITTKLLTYLNTFPAFEDSIEYKLIICLWECIRDNDIDGYEFAIRKFDSVSELSQWHVTLLLRAKNQIESDCLTCSK